MKQIEPTLSHLRVLASLRGHLWAIRPDYAPSLALQSMEVAEKPQIKGALDQDALDFLAEFYPMRKPMDMAPDGIAVIDVKGALMHDCPRIDETLGLATRYSTIIAEVKAAKEAGARGIVLRMDSPGGTVAGLKEAATAIRESGITSAAYASGLACSATYYLACSCSEIVASESAEVGNIGSIMAWTDCTAFWQANGIQFKALTNEGADLKSTFHLEPNETQIAFLQERLNEAGEDFRQQVLCSRRVSEEVFRAGWYSGEKAGELGLIDGIASFDEFRRSLAG